jgi:hypothetical protein
MRRVLLCLGLGVLLAACAKEELSQEGVLQFTTSVASFDGAPETRTNIAGNAFAVGDRMKLKIICPYSDHTQFGETTYGHSADAFWLFKWSGSEWSVLTAADKVDVEGEYRYSAAPSLYERFAAQQTPYVFTASTWSENVLFISGSKLYSQYSYVFESDQTAESDYLKSDLLWAQSYMQTGSYNVHLAFQHVMACLKIDISALGLSSQAVVTLEGMPDIDQKEVVVGDYYAARSKVNSKFGYQEKTVCTKEQNGKVLGVAVVSDASSKALVYALDGVKVPNTGVYTAHRDGDAYYLIVPPCTLQDQARFWVRDGEKRYSYQLSRTTFEQGKLYPVTITAE